MAEIGKILYECFVAGFPKDQQKNFMIWSRVPVEKKEQWNMVARKFLERLEKKT